MMMMTLEDLVLASVNKTRAMTEPEFWERYARTCRKHNVLPLVGQVKVALRRLVAEAKIVFEQNPVRIRKVV